MLRTEFVTLFLSLQRYIYIKCKHKDDFFLYNFYKYVLVLSAIAGNARVSAGYYEFYYMCLRWYFRTNEHISKSIKALVTY